MSTAQPDWVAALVFIGLPVYHLITSRSGRDDAFYRHLEAHSMIFPRSDSVFRGVFKLAWTLLFPAMGVAGFLFWRDADSTASGYTIGLVFYMIAVFSAYGWMRMFFVRRMVFTSFFMTFFGVLGCAAVFLGYSIFFSLVVPSILSGIWCGFTLYATLLTCIAAFSVPTYKEKTADELQPEATAQQQVFDVRAHAQQQQYQMAGAPCPSYAPLGNTKLYVPPAMSMSAYQQQPQSAPPGLVNRMMHL
jgi:tryptophan-rich sensory protein